MRLIQKLGDWFDLRLQLGTPIRETAQHPVPRETASWFYVFGSAALTCFMLQVVTGILLALIYVPSAGEAWNSLQTLNHGISLGWFIRALHGWGSNFMVAIVLIHMVQVFLFGAYKFPRELTWIVGVLLLLVPLGINEWPMPGRIVHRATYMQEYHELTHKQGVPFVPGAVGKDIVFSGFILLAIAACALYFGPFGPSGQPDPTIIQTAPHPDFFF